MDTKIDNLIGGQPINLGKVYFTSESPFYKDFNVLIADSGQLDVSIALSKIKNVWEDCQRLSFNERAEIVEKAATKLNFTDQEINSMVKMLGMPKKYVSMQTNQIIDIMKTFRGIVSKRYGFIDERIGTDFLENDKFHKIEFRIPKKGFVYAVTPGNDPRVTALVLTILALLGIPGIIKPSKNDNIIPLKVAKAIIDAGYPKNGLAILFLNSENPKSKKYNFKICDEAMAIWPFGDENTVDNLLRFETHGVFDVEKFLSEKGISNVQKDFPKILAELEKSKNSVDTYMLNQTIDHFASKVILRHASGRCTGILDDDFDLNIAAKMVIDSSMRYPIGCNSMKSLFVVESVFDKFANILKKEFAKLDKQTSDPLNPDTEVGYVGKDVAMFLEKRLNELKLLQHVSILHGGKKVSPMQLTPLLVSTNDINSELLINEISGYILCLTKVKSFEEGIAHINRLSQDSPRLAVSYFTSNPNNMKTHVSAHHVKVNYLTTDLDGIIHEGNDYIMQLTTPYMVHLHKEHLKKHPYRGKVN